MLNLLLGNIYVVGACEIVIVARTEESVALRHNFEQPLGKEYAVEVELRVRTALLMHLLLLLHLALTLLLFFAQMLLLLGLRLLECLVGCVRLTDDYRCGSSGDGGFLYFTSRPRSERFASRVGKK